MPISCRKLHRRCRRGCRFCRADTTGDRRRLWDRRGALRPARRCVAVGRSGGMLPPLPDAPAGVISSMIYASGTTGNPKGVRRLDMGPAATEVLAAMVRDGFGLAPDGVVRTVITGPLYHKAPNFLHFMPSAWAALWFCSSRDSMPRGCCAHRPTPHHPSPHGADDVRPVCCA
jgi:hypothetical protein